MKEQLQKKIADSLSNTISDLTYSEIHELIEEPKNKELGDLAFPCFLLAKALKKSPPQIAQELANTLARDDLPEGISKIIATGPFLNFKFDRGFFTSSVVSKQKTKNPEKQNSTPQTIIVEYSSPNIAKPFHVGHLRATLIGNCLDRVHRYLGNNVISINHLGDWGTQFGFVWAGCKIWGKPENDSVLELLEIYRKATSLKAQQESQVAKNSEADNEGNINQVAREFFLDLEAKKPYAIEFWQWCSKISLDYFKKTYARLGVKFDHYTGESFYSDMLKDVRKDLEEAGILSESEGAYGVDLGERLGFARIFTEDGRSLYLTRDLATAKYRAKTFNFDKSIYVVGSPQTLHFQQIVGVLEKLNRDYSKKIFHVAFGHVLGITTRGDGQFIELNEFLNEATTLAIQSYNQQIGKRPEGLDENLVANKVALSGIIFSNLSKNNIKDVKFDWNTALNFQGDSGPYLLYAYARINGIKEKAFEAGISLNPNANFSLLKEDSAFYLASMISDLEEVVRKTAEDNEPCNLCNYAIELAKCISKSYLDLKVLGVDTELAEARLWLFETAGVALAKTLELLGIEKLERM
jgi:arginyl-tRNA synthetase